MAKKLLSSSEYTFNANTGTVTFGDSLTGLELQNVELITNVTTNTVIYQFNKSGFGGSLTGLILTLDYDTSAMSDTDDLQIFIEGDLIRSDTNESIILLRRIAQLLSPIATQDSLQRQRVTVEVMPTTTVAGTVTVAQATAANLQATVTGTVAISSGTVTVGSITNLAGIGGVDARFQFVDAARTAYATGIRANLTNS
jgi:hypothetical protein